MKSPRRSALPTFRYDRVLPAKDLAEMRQLRNRHLHLVLGEVPFVRREPDTLAAPAALPLRAVFLRVGAALLPVPCYDRPACVTPETRRVRSGQAPPLSFPHGSGIFQPYTLPQKSTLPLMTKCGKQKKSPVFALIVSSRKAWLQSGRSPIGRYSTFFVVRRQPDSHQP